MIPLKTTICILLAIACIASAPAVSADPGQADADVGTSGTCVDVDPTTTPPVSVYECDTSTPPLP